MTIPDLRSFHLQRGAVFSTFAGNEIVAHYGDVMSEYDALVNGAGAIDLSCRGRICLLGADRMNFLHGQVTNSVKDLKRGQGVYAALANAKARLQCDLFVYNLGEELLLDFEPALAERVKKRLEDFIIADDVQAVDIASEYHLFSVQGPKARDIFGQVAWGVSQPLPARPLEVVIIPEGDEHGRLAINNPRLGSFGFDVFSPTKLGAANLELLSTPPARLCGWDAFEIVRIEQGVPRFGVDMDENTLVPEAIEHAINYSKGCYIGQEVIARIRTYGQVAKALRGIRIESGAPVPKAGDKVHHDGKEVGWITSAVFSPKLQRPIALGYVRKECNSFGTRLAINDSFGEIVPVPFQP